MAGGEVGVTLGQPHLSRQDLATLVSSRFAEGMHPELGGGHGLSEGVAMRHRPGVWSAGERSHPKAGPSKSKACHFRRRYLA